MNYNALLRNICVGLLPFSFTSLHATNPKPNIIVLFIDDLGYNDLGYRNSSFETHNIDQMASEGIDFANAYVPSPTSSPSRVGLLTGRHPLKVGFTRHIPEFENEIDPYNDGEYFLCEGDPGNKPTRQYMPLEEVTFAEALKKAGYTTCAIGKWHLGHEAYYPQKQGFDIVYAESLVGHPGGYYPPYFTYGVEHDRKGEYLTDYLTDCATEVIEKHDYSKTPLCMYLAHYGVHAPIEAPTDMVRKYIEKGIPKMYAIYHAMVECIDKSVGRILQSIEKAGEANNTIVMLISDQGGLFSNAPLKGGKLAGTALYDGSAKIPFIVKLPGLKEGRVVKERISTMDVFPTLLELAGEKISDYPQLDGMSLLPTFQGGKPVERPLLFYRSYDDQAAAVIDKGYKLIYTRSGNHELYNLNEDPNETENLISNEMEQVRVAKLKVYVEEFLAKYEPESIPYPKK